MSLLDRILANTRREVAARKERSPLAALRRGPLYGRTPHSLQRALAARTPAVIGEIKKASPSRGVIRADFDPSTLARSYAAGGADALSVLTDRSFFQGDLGHLRAARAAVEIPILRKDFVVDPYQLHEAKEAGADAVLLIAAALPAAELHALHDEAAEIGLECLVEVHTAEELSALDLHRLRLVGINNRDLATFATDLATSVRLRPLIPRGIMVVAESGIGTPKDLRTLLAAGITAFLIGERFMTQPDPGGALAAMREAAQSETPEP
jgi:indole-3-glycerol phosphate synthase